MSTNDRFSAQLRQHLLQTADVRPAEGQLAAVVKRVAAVPQRPSIVARLTWFPGRIGPFPAIAFRYGLIAAALIGATLAGTVLVGGAPGPGTRSVFEGTWTSTDPSDDSTQFLVVGGGTHPPVRFVDEFATGAACVNDPIKRFTADGTGTIDGDHLDVAFPDGGGCGLVTVGIALVLDYRTASDTLVDQDHVVWSRVVGGDVPATDEPGSDAPPTEEASSPPSSEVPGSACIDLAHGGTYTAPAGPLSLTATLPSSPVVPWEGLVEAFDLSSRCLESSPMSFHASIATSVNDSSCMPNSLGITSFADAVARLDTPKGDDISDRVDLTIDGHPAARYDITRLTTCEAFGLWDGTLLGAGETGSVYVIDVDGVLVAIELNRDGRQSSAELAEAWAIVASLQFAD